MAYKNNILTTRIKIKKKLGCHLGFYTDESYVEHKKHCVASQTRKKKFKYKAGQPKRGSPEEPVVCGKCGQSFKYEQGTK